MNTSNLTVRPVSPADEALLLAWANDAETRANSFSPRPIKAKEHRAWLAARLHTLGYRGYLLEADGVPVAVVWYARERHHWEASVTVAPEHRGQGYGKAALQLAPAPSGRLRALVFAGNVASRRAFEAAGYTAIGQHCLLLEKCAW